MIKKQLGNSVLLLEILLLVLLAALTYLPNLSQATIYRDDWYYTMDGLIGGPSIFPVMFSIDRPARGIFFELYFRLFGITPAPYHVASFVWRLLMGLAALWFFHQFWPKRRYIAVGMAALFVIFPGYTRWMEGFENQPKVFALFMMALSFALTLQALKTSRPVPKILLWTGSIVSGLINVALVDYGLGMEIFRYVIIFIFVNRGREREPLLQRGLAALRAGFPTLLISVIFLFWRLLIFHNLRAQTDLGGQLDVVIQSPLTGLAAWATNFIQSIINIAILSWGATQFQNLFVMRTRDISIGLLLALLSAAVVVGGFSLIRRLTREHDDQAGLEDVTVGWQKEAIWLGALGVVVGVLPVIVANRYAGFGAYSHYMLPASFAAAMLVIGVIGLLPGARAQLIAATIIVVLAVLNQYTASSIILNEETTITNFWQQASWRMPGLKAGTTLIVYYPGISYSEDVDAVNGPANLIYFPQPTGQMRVQYQLNGVPQYAWTAKQFIEGGTRKGAYRTHFGINDYNQVLVMTQGSEDACVHVIDRQWPWYSYNDRDPVMLMGSGSDPGNILADGSHAKLNEAIFGPEPVHGWCYYFERADLALQEKNWQKIVSLGDEVVKRKLHASEQLEWIPFLQAYAVVGDDRGFSDSVSRILSAQEHVYNGVQACNVMVQMKKMGYTFSSSIQSIIRDRLCNNNY